MTIPFLPYGRQALDEADIQAVVAVLRSDWLTQGPAVEAFEKAFATQAGAAHAVAVNSGTAALHAAVHALGLGPGDEVIVPPITFTASANCAVFEGATPVFADVDAGTLLLDPGAAERTVTPRTRAIVAVDYSGHPCDYDRLRALAAGHGLALIADACHAPGASYKGRPVGSLADVSAFSFHPVKHITTGEGGLVTTDRADLAQKMRDFRTHGITRDRARMAEGVWAGGEYGPWYYEMQELGFNYRLSDLNCALGLSQLGKLAAFVARRRAIAARYHAGFAGLDGRVRCLKVEPWAAPAWHLFVVRVDFQALGRSRADVMQGLRERGVGTQVHYIPVHLQPYYRRRFGTRVGQCPVAEAAYRELLSLPMYPTMTDADVDRVVDAVRAVTRG